MTVEMVISELPSPEQLRAYLSGNNFPTVQICNKDKPESRQKLEESNLKPEVSARKLTDKKYDRNEKSGGKRMTRGCVI